jgi:hypothetical protein
MSNEEMVKLNRIIVGMIVACVCLIVAGTIMWAVSQ